MAPFKSPNHTQTPNDLFDEYLSVMGEAELKVVLALIRETLGFHRRKAKMSLTQLQKATGMSRQGVLNGAENAEKRGLISRKSAPNGTSWVVNVVDHPHQEKEPEVVNVVDQGSQRSRPIQSGLKKDLKKKPLSPNGEGEDQPSGDVPGEESIKVPNELRKFAETIFRSKTGLAPLVGKKGVSSNNARWWTPLRQICVEAGADREVVQMLIEGAVDDLGLDKVYAPQSIINTLSKVKARLNGRISKIQAHQDGGIE